MIFVVGIGLSFFLAILLIAKKPKSFSDQILTFWMILIALHLLSFYHHSDTELIQKYPHFLGTTIPFPLMQGVFLFWYVASLTGNLPKKKIFMFLHLIPAIIDYIILSFLWFFLDAETKLQLHKSIQNLYLEYVISHMILTIISGVVYITWSLFLLSNHKKRIRDNFSDLEKVNLNWLRIMIYGIAVIWLAIFLQNFLLTEQLNQSVFGKDRLIFSTVVAFVAILGYFGIQQTSIFTKTSSLETKKELPKPKKANIRYAKSGLKEAQAKALKEQLIFAMQNEKLYLKRDLSLKELATKFSIHSNYLSQVINEHFGKNFYDFINEYRIDAFKKLVQKPENKNLTILAIAYDCGFNSKSSFNKYFKKSTGITPSEFVKNQK